ncbi:MAG: DEAD/DEAH box helicase [Chitinivibrionales bacterium]|nr:DEAD/DEAH box helicase [Chitinivibrionales bacterium]
MQYLGYTLDPFQEQAVEAINQGESLIVAAPTGCGKTLIAEYAVEAAMDKGLRIVYTAPIKTLSNQKFRDFRARFGEEAVGIHTGDVTINPEGRLLIMTTEIFRNLILEKSPRLNEVYYAIFDEIHFLDDPERGTVWEESIILAPQNIRFLCLSATVPNIHEIADWMSKVRHTRFHIIEEHHRPVPLKHYLFSPKYGNITIKGIRKKFKKNYNERKKFLRRKPSSHKIVSRLIQEEHLPALYFCFNRRACERNAELHSRLDLLAQEEHARLKELVNQLVSQYGLQSYEGLGNMRQLWESGCAYHHAGMLPAAKEIVERLFTSGLIKLLFSTSTFALGINMPAKAVVFDQVEKFDGVEFSYLMTREYNQMAGRAGRRGMDDVGHVYAQIIPEATDPREIERLMYGKNEKITSQFFASYATILNLYSQFGDKMMEMFRLSFSNFKKGTFALTKSYRREENQIHNRIRFLQDTGFLDGTLLTDKGKLAAAVSGYEIQAAELYYTHSFDTCPVDQFPVVLGALVTEESRKNKETTPSNVMLTFEAAKIIKKLRRQEIRHNIEFPISEMNFSLAAPIFAWAKECTFTELQSFGFPEGDMIRVLRMIIQLLRTLRDKLPDPIISDRMHEALELVNRDVVDAQAELEADLPGKEKEA